MVYQRSNIGASLNKKRKLGFVKKISVYIVFILFFISLGILGLTKEPVRIKSVVVSGNYSVSTDDIAKIVENELDVVYFRFIPTDNILFLRESRIKSQILDNFKKIGSVKILINGVDKIEVSVIERESKNLWCKGTLANKGSCYFMDLDGFIFEEAPQFSLGTFPEYFGLIKDEDPIGQFYFRNNFKNISSLYATLKKISFIPKYFNAIDEHEYEVILLSGAKILINDSKSFESSLMNLQAIVDNSYIKNDAESLKKIKYIDLRFGNKVNFELVK